MLRKALILCAGALAAYGANPAAARTQTSFCAVDELSKSELGEVRDAFFGEDSLADVRSGFFTRSSRDLDRLVARIVDECAAKAGKDVATKPAFVDFVRWDVITFAFRDILIARDFEADALDRRIDMPCKLALFPNGGELSMDGAELIGKAFADAGQPLDGLDEEDLRLGVLYVAAASEYWRQGLKLGILPRCSAKS